MGESKRTALSFAQCTRTLIGVRFDLGLFTHAAEIDLVVRVLSKPTTG